MPVKSDLLKSQESALLDQIKSEGRCGKDISLAGGCCMGTGAFIYASNYAEYGLVGSGLLGPIPFVTTSIARISRALCTLGAK